MQDMLLHSFNRTTAHIMLALEYAGSKSDSSCNAVIAGCYAIHHQLPMYADFTEAFNKLLYLGAVVIEGEKVTLSSMGIELLAKARSKLSATEDSAELLKLVYKELCGYKLKSMCNRTVWSENQYQSAIVLAAI